MADLSDKKQATSDSKVPRKMKIVKRYCGETLVQAQVFVDDRKFEIDWKEGNFSRVSFSSQDKGVWRSHAEVSFTKINEKTGALSCKRDDSVRFVDINEFFSGVPNDEFGKDKEFQQNVDLQGTYIGLIANEKGTMKRLFFWVCECNPDENPSVQVRALDQDWGALFNADGSGKAYGLNRDDIDVVKESVDSPSSQVSQTAPISENTVIEDVNKLDIVIPSAMDTNPQGITISVDDASIKKNVTSHPQYTFKKDVQNMFLHNWRIKGY